jgi:hypothetical protein
MVPFFLVFSLVGFSVAAVCCALRVGQVQVARTEDWCRRENGGGVGMAGGLARIPEDLKHFQDRNKAAKWRCWERSFREEWHPRRNDGGVGKHGGLARIPEEFKHFQTAKWRCGERHLRPDEMYAWMQRITRRASPRPFSHITPYKLLRQNLLRWS